MKGTDHIDKNGEGLIRISVDFSDLVGNTFKRILTKYHPIDVFFGSVIGSLMLLLTVIAVAYQVTALLIILGVAAVVLGAIYAGGRWWDFIHSKSKEYKSE